MQVAKPILGQVDPCRRDRRHWRHSTYAHLLLVSQVSRSTKNRFRPCKTTCDQRGR